MFDRVGIAGDTALCQRLDHSRRGTHLGQAASARLPLAIIVSARVNSGAKRAILLRMGLILSAADKRGELTTTIASAGNQNNKTAAPR
jgi:hypothetical protein